MGKHKTAITVVSKLDDERPRARDSAVVVIHGADLGRKHNILGGQLTVGRSSKSDLQIDEESVSRQHCRIADNGRQVVIKDLGSTNGTYVNDELVDEIVLRNGDLIQVGRTILKFLANDVEAQYHEEIYRLTTVDGLTQVHNKRYLLEALEREMSRCTRYGRTMSLVLFDIDHFKKINDTHGHLAGDGVLRALATLVRPRIRREDVFARFGGEEFAIVLPEVDAEGAAALGEKVRRLVERHRFRFEDGEIDVTVSVGSAVLTPEITDPDSFLRVADTRLYEAKQGGRNRVVG